MAETELQAAFSRFLESKPDLAAETFYNEPLRHHCTFQIGGEAEILCVPKTEGALRALLGFGPPEMRRTVLGCGSNVLFPDEGLPGLVIKLAGGLTDVTFTGDGTVAAGAGVQLSRLCLFALEQGLSGLEFAYGIPGSVGGAVYMNAGAYGGEIKDVLLSVRAVSLRDGSVYEYQASELDMRYRSTPFMQGEEIVTAARFRLTPGEKTEIEEKMRTLLGKRRASQPLELPSAGSTFKRPVGGYAAAMIDKCGLKGLTVGGAQVSKKHAGFVVNTGGATAADVTALIREIQKRVQAETGVLLEPEVEIL